MMDIVGRDITADDYEVRVAVLKLVPHIPFVMLLVRSPFTPFLLEMKQIIINLPTRVKAKYAPLGVDYVTNTIGWQSDIDAQRRR